MTSPDRMMKGTCAICLEFGEMSFEHVPPRRAFNNSPTVAHTIYGLELGSKRKKPPPLLKAPAGLGRHTLCAGCNGRTASWYGSAFADWTKQCLRYAERLRGGGNVLLPFDIQPLNVVKQVLVMALAVSGSKSGGNDIDHLRHFVLSKQAAHLPTEYAVKTYFNPTDPARVNKPLLTQNRLSESCALLDTRSGAAVFVLAEIAFPPMGYVVYSNTREAQAYPSFAKLCDLRGFGTSYYGQRKGLFLHIPIRYPYGPVPGYYPNLNRKEVPILDDDHVVMR